VVALSIQPNGWIFSEPFGSAGRAVTNGGLVSAIAHSPTVLFVPWKTVH
jgi:hypothetical protein